MDVTDHVIQQPDQVQFEGFISNTPLYSTLGWSPETLWSAAASGELKRRAQALYWDLLRLKERGALVGLSTTLRGYTDMVIESVEVPVSGADGDGLRIPVSMRRIEKVGTRTVQVTFPKANKKVNKGRQTVKPADAKTGLSADSMLKDFVNPTRPGSMAIPTH